MGEFSKTLKAMFAEKFGKDLLGNKEGEGIVKDEARALKENKGNDEEVLARVKDLMEEDPAKNIDQNAL